MIVPAHLRPRFGLGVDPGIKACGLALVRCESVRWSRHTSLTVRSTSKQDFVTRLHAIAEAGRRLINSVRPHVEWIGIEDPLYVIAGKHREHETNFDALRLMAVLGLACDWGFEFGIPVILVDTGEVKRAVGAPQTADKDQVQRCVRAMVQNCAVEDFDEHQADACAAVIASGRRLVVDGALNAAREKRR